MTVLLNVVFHFYFLFLKYCYVQTCWPPQPPSSTCALSPWTATGPSPTPSPTRSKWARGRNKNVRKRCLYYALKRTSHLRIPRKAIAWPSVRIFTLMCLWAIYMFAGSVPIFSCSRIGRPMVGIYKYHLQTQKIFKRSSLFLAVITDKFDF